MVNLLLLLLFFLSGFAALLYQIIWQRILTFFSGADVYAVTIIVAAFMAGLGFGSLIGGHIADRLQGRALVIGFAICEVAVATFALLSVSIYYDVLYLRLGSWALPRFVMALVVFLVTLWPTLFMGMSLPLITKALTANRQQPARWVPLLYGWNTLGAAFGSFTTVAVIFRRFDFPWSVRTGAALSLLCAAVAFAASFRVHRRPQPLSPGPAPNEPISSGPASRPLSLGTWIGVYALSGFVALSFEILWFRVLGVLVKSNSFTFGYMLAIYLFGVGAGAIAGNHRRIAAWPPTSSFLVLQALLPACAGLSLTALVYGVGRISWADPLWSYMAQYETLDREALSAGFASLASGHLRGGSLLLLLYVIVPVWLMFVPTFMMGMSFAHIQRAVQTDYDVLGRRIGWLQAANITGAMAGALLTGLALLDWLGSAGTLRGLVACGTIFAALIVYTQTRRAGRVAGGCIGVGILATAFLVPDDSVFWARLHGETVRSTIHAEDGSGLSLVKLGEGGPTELYANGLGQGTIPFGGIHTALGALPAMLHPAPRHVAIIGLGSGDTVFAVGGRPETVRIDSVEIIEPELETLRQLDARWFNAGLRHLLQDPRVQHWFTDGRAMLMRGGARYDIIEADALRPTSAYAGNLFSVEYFETLRRHLEPGGLAVTWVPTDRVRDTFLRVFPHVLLFDLIAIGSTTPIPFSPETIASRMAQDFTRRYYASAGVRIEQQLRPYLESSPLHYGPEFNRASLWDVNRDLFPKDEFAIPRQ